MFIASKVTSTPSIGASYWDQYRAGNDEYNFITHQAACDFAKDDEAGENNQERTLEICNEADAKIQREGGIRKRKLVSLMEANEVARRETVVRMRYGVAVIPANSDDKKDIISEWI